MSMAQNIQEQVRRSAHERWISTGLAGRLMRLCPNLFPDLAIGDIIAITFIVALAIFVALIYAIYKLEQ